MDKCPEHPQFYVSNMTPCPGCSKPPHMPNEWMRTALINMVASRMVLESNIQSLKTHLNTMSGIALVGWVVVVVQAVLL